MFYKPLNQITNSQLRDSSTSQSETLQLGGMGDAPPSVDTGAASSTPPGSSSVSPKIMKLRSAMRARKNNHRPSLLLQSDAQANTNSKMIEEKLIEQFRYFRQEFMDAALAVGIPVPLDMVEDKMGRLFTFVSQKGPRYLLQTIHTYPDSVHMIRCALSLLIVTISILRNKLPNNSERNTKGNSSWLSLLTENISTWALDSLTSIADGAAVAICINLLRNSHVQSIQELVLNLLAQLVNITEEAAAQMLSYPAIVQQEKNSNDSKDLDSDSRGQSTMRSRDESRRDSPLTRRGLPSPTNGFAKDINGERSFTCLSYMFSVVSLHRNRYMVMAACAEVVLALCSSNSSTVCEAIARTSICPLPEPNTLANKRKQMRRLHRNSLTVAKNAAKAAKKLPEPEDWAALKLMLKFLKRFIRYVQNPTSDGAWNITTAFERQTLTTSHSRVLLAVCALVINSNVVASYVFCLPGARLIIETSGNLHNAAKNVRDTVNHCLRVLHEESTRIYELEASRRHSSSYEATHGRQSFFRAGTPMPRPVTIGTNSACSIETSNKETVTSVHTIEEEPQEKDRDTSPPRANTPLSSDSRRASYAGSKSKSMVSFDELLNQGTLVKNDSSEHVLKSITPFGSFVPEEMSLPAIKIKDSLVVDTNTLQPTVEEDAMQCSASGDDECNEREDEYDKKPKSAPARVGLSTGRLPVHYSPPESPVRRGLSPFNGGIPAAGSLHRDFFSTLPNKPPMPTRLEPEVVARGIQDESIDLERASHIQQTIEACASKGEMPIVERARKIYSQRVDSRPSTGYASRPSTGMSRESRLRSPGGTIRPSTSKMSRDAWDTKYLLPSGLLLDGLGGMEPLSNEFKSYLSSYPRAKTAPSDARRLPSIASQPPQGLNTDSVLSDAADAEPRQSNDGNRILQSVDMLFP